MGFSSMKFALTLVLALILTLPLAQLAMAETPSIIPPWQQPPLTAQQKADEASALRFLISVVGLDMTKYNAKASVDRHDPYNPNLPPPIVEETVHYNLTSPGRKELDVLCLFRGNSLVWCKLYYPADELPFFVQPASSDSLISAKGLLDRIQNFSATTYLPTMRSMLDSVAKPENSTVIVGNVTQEVSVEGDTMTIRWKSSVNGVENTQKAMRVTLQDGHLQFFCDNWNLYKIGNANVNVSEQEAIQIAVKAARAYSWTAGNQTVSNITVLDTPASLTLSMQNRGNYTLYPLWDILLPLDKVYPGLVTGIHVSLWADTGDVSFITATGGGGVPSAASSSTPSLEPSTPAVASEPAEYEIVMIAMLIAVTVSIASYLFYKRRR
jgi:hypothetical protein